MLEAIRNGDLRGALALAIEAWRATRDPAMADLVDRIAARLPRIPAPGRAEDVHAWWMELARAHDPATVATLLERVTTRLRANDASFDAAITRWPDVPVSPSRYASSNWLERCAVLLAWPDDPRVARVLVDWLIDPNPYVTGAAADVCARALADRIVALGDVRVVSRLAAADAPHARRAADALRAITPSRADVAAIVAALPPLETERLWAIVAERPWDLAARSALGDALLEAGDDRGELIGLSLAIGREPAADPARDRRAIRLRRLLDDGWQRWLGDLARVAVRDGTEIANGMIEVIRVGHSFTRPWMWAIARGHRELCAVHTVRAHVADPAAYAAFVADLPHLRRVQLDGPDPVRALAAAGRRTAIAAIEYVPSARIAFGDATTAPIAFEALAAVAPDLEHVELAAVLVGPGLGELAAALPRWFPALREIEVIASSRVEARALADQLGALPLVRVR